MHQFARRGQAEMLWADADQILQMGTAESKRVIWDASVLQFPDAQFRYLDRGQTGAIPSARMLCRLREASWTSSVARARSCETKFAFANRCG